MKKVAALYTCHNRKEKTLNSIRSLREAYTFSNKIDSLDVYLTDDGSTDGTSEAIKIFFPDVIIIKGSGNLFWTEGMRSSWKEALKKEYDAFLLLNDDVELYKNMFDELLEGHQYCIDTFGKSGIYLGATEDKTSNKLTYSGSIITNKFLYKRKRLAPNGQYQRCHLGNANIMLVPSSIVEHIGILSTGYSHGMADYDYTLTANSNGIPVLIAKNFCGHCVNDHKDHYEGFINKSFEERKKVINSPTGLALNSYKIYMRKFFPYRYPFVTFFGWFKLYFPKTYISLFKK